MKVQNSRSVGSVVDGSLSASRVALSSAGFVAAGCFAMSLAAQVRIPVPGTDVPMTLQLLGVFLIGFALRPALAVAAMVLYVACGASGLPVFASSGGLAGATCGYILGFIPAVWLVSSIGHRSRAGVGRLLIAGLCGTLVVFAIGVGWRVVFFGGFGSGEAALGLAMATGVAPFAVKAMVELALATAGVRCVGRLNNGRRKNLRPIFSSDQV